MSRASAVSVIVAGLLIASATSVLGSGGSANLVRGRTGPGIEAAAEEVFTYDPYRAGTPSPLSRGVPASTSGTTSPAPLSGTSSPAPHGEISVVEPVVHVCDPVEGATSFRFSDVYGECDSLVSPSLLEPPELPDDRRGPRRGRGPSPEEVRASVIDRAISLAPAPELRIAPGRIGLTGLPSFFWLAEEPQPITASAGVRGLTVTATAAPSHYIWDFGDGAQRTTRNPGRPWTPSRDGSIEHTYETKGTHELSIAVVWEASWSMNGGPPQSLGTFTTSDSEDYPVREIIPFLTAR